MVDTKKEHELRPGGTEQVIGPVEMVSKPEINLEVSSWMEKIEKKFARVPNQTSDVSDDSVVVQPTPQTDQPPVTLPINQQQMTVGKKAKTDTGIAWLVSWAIRQIKIFTRMGRKVRLEDMPEVTDKSNGVKE